MQIMKTETRNKLIMDLYDEDLKIYKRLKHPWNIDIEDAESVAQAKRELEDLKEALHYRMELIDGDHDGEIEAIFSREFANIERYEGVEFAEAILALEKCKLLLDMQFSFYCTYQDIILSFPIEKIFEDETSTNEMS